MRRYCQLQWLGTESPACGGIAGSRNRSGRVSRGSVLIPYPRSIATPVPLVGPQSDPATRQP